MCHRDTTSRSATESLLIPFQTLLLHSLLPRPSDSIITTLPIPQHSRGPSYNHHQPPTRRGNAYVGTRAKKEQNEPVKPNCCSTRHSWKIAEPSQLGLGQLPSLWACLNLNSSCLHEGDGDSLYLPVRRVFLLLLILILFIFFSHWCSQNTVLFQPMTFTFCASNWNKQWAWF